MFEGVLGGGERGGRGIWWSFCCEWGSGVGVCRLGDMRDKGDYCCGWIWYSWMDGLASIQERGEGYDV